MPHKQDSPHPFEPADLELVNGFYIKPIGKRYCVMSRQHVAIHNFASAHIAISKLMQLRSAWADGYAARAYESDQVTRELLATA